MYQINIFSNKNLEIICGDSLLELRKMKDESVDCVITSPPYYGLRNYNSSGQIGLEKTPEEYISNLVSVFSETKRVLKKSGTLWIVIGDTYCGTGAKGKHKDPKNREGRNSQAVAPVNQKIEGMKSKDLIGIPWMLAFALRADGWYLRQDIVWNKGNAMPEPVRDRCTRSHEYVFLLSKSKKYYFDFEALREHCADSSVKDFKGRRNLDNKSGLYSEVRPDLVRSRDQYICADFKRRKRSVWTINTKPYKGAHFAVFPDKLIEPCVLAGCPEGGTVLDPFAGAGTTGLVSSKNNRKSILVDLNPDYCDLMRKRLGVL